jgi:glycosyltransferase involved in cell wall biosynthesis
MNELAPHADIIFSHMTPRYVLLAAPYARRFHKRQVLWFTHRQVSWQLKQALRLCWRVVTADDDSFPIQSPKLRVLGHGIDTRFYAPDLSVPADSPPVVVHVARLMPIKHQESLLRALPNLPGVHAVFVGGVPSGQDAHYAERLERQAKNFGVSDRVAFTGGLPAEQVRDWYRRATVAVNLSPTGLFDKTALESMATGTMTLVSSPAFDELLGANGALLRISTPDNVDELTAHLKTLIALSAIQRGKIGAGLREHVMAQHSIENLMPRLVQVFQTGEAVG